ncbi:chorismate mutase [Streptomyces sp. NBC_01264]|uniref:chorismate mutase n=1 Tax=Streptomyces sp. NBC_01264 TaxID=2903804 RepID=UPI00225B6CCE|nr:chorismate mutase [Streptomyces sp. NBC_01264]MCX4781803.1 chorismate mutase [Streptomyces sp. NBC_01264]
MRTFRRSIVLIALTCGSAALLVACGSSQHPEAVTGPEQQGLAKLVRLSAERVMTADTVAAAKWGTAQPIDDPARERAVLDAATSQAAERGIDRADVQRIFEGQITANKTVQRALYAAWESAPALRPTARPDLSTEVRPVLDRIDGDLLTAIQEAQPLLSSPGCGVALDRAKAATAGQMDLDAPHRIGLDQALADACVVRPR